jgi:predicted ATPase/class 3 adenylate cyclase
MRCPNCHTENPGQAKFCLECGNRLVICPHCGTVNLTFAKFCIECGTALQTRTTRTEEAIPLPTIKHAPLDKHNHHSQNEINAEWLLPPEERRIVTIMFADITSYTPLADRLDPEDMRAILTGYFNLMAEQIRKHEGTIEKYIGDAVMAVFGSPIAHEDDPDRAVRAALDMQEALNRFNEQRLLHSQTAMRLQMRIGINTGEVAIPNSVNYARQDFLITGDAVNVAARLQQAATPETILVGERTYLTTREVFDFRALAPMHVKGKPEPINAYVVIGLKTAAIIIAQHPRGLEGRRTPLIGRTLELTLLHANYARVLAERRPHLITILGQPGIGKSRLMREFIAREQERQKSASSLGRGNDPKILRGRCPPYGEGLTYWPLIEILRSLLQAQEGETIEALQERFFLLVNETLKSAKRSESAEEISETLLRSIGRDLSGKVFSADKNWPRRDYQASVRSATTSTKQGGGTQVALLRAWRVLLEALAEQQPLIIVVDDLQWADEALLDLLEYLTERITSVPILFLCPARPDFFERRRDWGGGQRNFTTIELEALSTEESNELVDALLNFSELPEALLYTILTRAEGNPFFVEELIRMFIDQNILIREEDQEQGTSHWRLNAANDTLLREMSTIEERTDDALINRHYLLPLQHVPDTIQGVLAARVDLLNPVEKLVLQHAAIIGRTFSLSALVELAVGLSREIILDALIALISRDFIVESSKMHNPERQDRSFSFKHILIRDVVYNNIPRMRRSQEHTRIALWYESQGNEQHEAYAEFLAYHYQQALLNWTLGFSLTITDDDQDVSALLTREELRQRAITYLTMAGDQALHSYYTIRALQAYNDAFELLVDHEESCTLQIIQMHARLGNAHFQRGNIDDAWQEYRRALRMANNTTPPAEGVNLLDLYDRMAELGTRWRGMFNNAPDLAEIRTYIDAGLKLLGAGALSRSKVAFVTYQAFWHARSLETANNARKAELAGQALASGHEALKLAEELKDPSALSLTLDGLGFIYAEYHRYNEVHRLQHRRQALEPELTDRGELYDLYLSLGYTHEAVADYPNALMWFGRAWSNAQTMESPPLLLICLTGRMRAWRQWNRWENARQVAHEIINFTEQYQRDEKGQLWALETLATIAYRKGEQADADQYARQYKRLIDQQVERSEENTRLLLSTKMHAIHLAREDWKEALLDYQTKLESSEPLPSPEVLATLAELLVITGASQEEQEKIGERAINQAESSGARKSLIIALRARGRMYVGQQVWNLAEDNLRNALRYCEVMDIPWERANTLYCLGDMYRQRAGRNDIDTTASQRNADHSRARYYFEQALGFFESLEARPSVERIRTLLNKEKNILV